jgi:predicted RNA-binding protein YlxR (DUF448 family)
MIAVQIVQSPAVVAGPVRTCVGCRRRGPAAAMARLALAGGRVLVWQGRGRPAGRGASVHRDEACLAKAARSEAFARAFRRPVEGVDTAELLRQITAAASTAAASRKKP